MVKKTKTEHMDNNTININIHKYYIINETSGQLATHTKNDNFNVCRIPFMDILHWMFFCQVL